MELIPKKRGAAVWRGVCRGTAWLYRVIRHSLPGRVMTAYREVDSRLTRGNRYPGRDRCRPMSAARHRLVSALESGHLPAALRSIMRMLLVCPLRFWGLFGLFYGAFGVLLCLLMPIIYPPLSPGAGHMTIAIVLIILSLPFLFTRSNLADALRNSILGRGLLIGLLGVPDEQLRVPPRRMPIVLPYLALLLGMLAAGGALFIHPLAVPLGLLALAIGGMIFTYPEAGVVLSTALLPVIWLHRDTLYILAALIVVTWISYAVKLLFLHRTMRFDCLDIVVLIFGGIVLASGFTGVAVGQSTIMQGLLLFVCLSDYFLIVNLITTRAFVRRCLVGVGASVLIVTVLSYLRVVPLDALSWLEGSRAGDAIIETFHVTVEKLSGLWVEHSELFLVLVFPCLYAYLMHTKRLLRRVLALIFIALDLLLIIWTGSVSALGSALCVTLVFFLLMSHKWMAAGLVGIPLGVAGVLWINYLYPLTEAGSDILSWSRHYKGLLRDSLWQMVRDFPAGIGMGEEAFVAVYPAYAAPDLGAVTDSGNVFFEVLLNYGWQGMLLLLAVVFFFLQKSLTCLCHTGEARDRAMILGGIASLIGTMIFGTVRSYVTSPRVFFTLVVLIALCSAYQNIIFDESDVLNAVSVGSPAGEDRIWRRGTSRPPDGLL